MTKKEQKGNSAAAEPSEQQTSYSTRVSQRAPKPSDTPKERKVSLGGAIIGAFVALVVGVLVGIGWNVIAPKFLPYLGLDFAISTENVDWSSLDEVYNALKKNYDGDIDDNTLIEGAKQGMAASLGDVYTSYMPAAEAAEFTKSLHGEAGSGIGAVIAKRDGYVRILRTLPDNPARKAGMLAGDIIYKIDGEEVYTLPADEISAKLKGDAGTKVQVMVVRDGVEKTFDLVREAINNVSADVTYDGSTAIIKVTRFDTDTGTLVEQFAKEFADKGIKKVILDLRDNGGGYVSAARDLLSLWIDGEVVLIQKSAHHSTEKTYANHGRAILKDMPTIVLTNGGTASASEIVAGALKDYSKATILGEKTYGKGVVQSLLNLSANSLLKVTSAHWYTPLDTSINGTGITPDVEVINTYEDINAGRDPQLDAAKKA